MTEHKRKLTEVFDNESAMRMELSMCKQITLAAIQASAAFELVVNACAKECEIDKFELESKV